MLLSFFLLSSASHFPAWAEEMSHIRNKREKDILGKNSCSPEKISSADRVFVKWIEVDNNFQMSMAIPGWVVSLD